MTKERSLPFVVSAPLGQSLSFLGAGLHVKGTEQRLDTSQHHIRGKSVGGLSSRVAQVSPFSVL